MRSAVQTDLLSSWLMDLPQSAILMVHSLAAPMQGGVVLVTRVTAPATTAWISGPWALNGLEVLGNTRNIKTSIK